MPDARDPIGPRPSRSVWSRRGRRGSWCCGVGRRPGGEHVQSAVRGGIFRHRRHARRGEGIRDFDPGTRGQAVLITTLAVLVAALSAGAGILELRRPPFGRLLLVLLAAVAATAAVTRADAGILAFVPAAVAAFVSALVLSWLVGTRRSANQDAAPTDGLARRGFLTLVTATAGAGILALVVGRVLGAGSQVVVKARELFTLPAAAVTAAPLPAPLQVTGHHTVHHPQSVLLPHRHGVASATARPRQVDAQDRRNGRPSVHAVIRRTPRAAVGREPDHAGVRVELRRRRLDRQCHVAGLSDPDASSASRSAVGCRHGAVHQQRRLHGRDAADRAHRSAQRHPRGRNERQTACRWSTGIRCGWSCRGCTATCPRRNG